MEEQINHELTKLQEELNLLDSAVKQIEKAGAISNNVIEAIQGIQEQYGKHLQKITNKYEDYLEKSLLNTDEKLDEIGVSHKEQIAEVQKLMDTYLELAEATARLPEEISGIDFPVRLDRIDTNTADINQGILNTQKLIDSMERRLKSDYRRVGELEKKIKKQTSSVNTIKILVIIILLVNIFLAVAQIVPQLGN